VRCPVLSIFGIHDRDATRDRLYPNSLTHCHHIQSSGVRRQQVRPSVSIRASTKITGDDVDCSLRSEYLAQSDPFLIQRPHRSASKVEIAWPAMIQETESRRLGI